MSKTQQRIGPIPQVPREVLRRILPSENPFVTNVNEKIGVLNVVSAKLPHQYRWRFRTAEAMTSELAQIARGDCLAVNLLYWRDQLGNWEAYSLMNTFRVIDLARSCVWALGREDTVCASLLARAGLETAAAFLDVARVVAGAIEGGPLLDPTVDLGGNIVISEELEQFSLKTIFAVRLPEFEKIYSPTNILTIITRVSELIQGEEFVLSTYEILCEVAHPNMLGRYLYWHGSEPGPREGNEVRVIGPGNGPVSHSLAAHIVAALSWACHNQAVAVGLMHQTIGKAAIRLNAAEQTPTT
jgi:hypothetical protein